MTEQCQEWIAYCVSKYPCKGSVLEVGSFDVNGNPRHHFADKERFGEYVGIDMREGPCVDKVMNVQQMEFQDNSFDVIVDAERLEHDNRFWVSIKELFRVLKPGGYIIVTTRSWGGMHPHAYPHDYWRFMDSGLKDLLEYAGFECLSTAYGERWAAGDKAVFAVGRKPQVCVCTCRCGWRKNQEAPRLAIVCQCCDGRECTEHYPKKAAEETRLWHVVIPSAKEENLIPCVKAIFENEPNLPHERIIVVDDGARTKKSEKALPGITWVKGQKPFIFARNANLGIKAAKSDVILLNDDAILETPGGFSLLVKQDLEYRPAIVSAAIRGVVGNKNQERVSEFGRRLASNSLCFICVCIPKHIQNAIGLLDERFVGYGFEDNDYCRRAREADFFMLVDDGCVVEHKSLASTFRSNPAWTEQMKQAQQIYAEKWT